MKQPALSLVAFTGTLRPAAQYRLQVTELRTGRESEGERQSKREKVMKHVVWGEVDGKEASRLTNTIFLIIKSRFVS